MKGLSLINFVVKKKNQGLKFELHTPKKQVLPPIIFTINN